MKRRILGAFLVLFAVWPLVQHVLVRTQEVDPWRLFGWAMYCVPGPMKTVRVVEVARDGSHRPLDYRRHDPEDRLAVDLFRIRRQSLGRLASGDALAGHMLERHPEWEGVSLPVLTLSLDRESARTVYRIHHETWWRDGSRDTLVVPDAVFGASR